MNVVIAIYKMLLSIYAFVFSPNSISLSLSATNSSVVSECEGLGSDFSILLFPVVECRIS